MKVKAFQNDVATAQHEKHPKEYQGEIPTTVVTDENNEKNMKALEKFLSEIENGYDDDYDMMNNNFF